GSADHGLPLFEVNLTLLVGWIGHGRGQEILSPALGDAAKQVVFVAEAMVDLDAVAVSGNAFLRIIREVPDSPRQVRQRIQRKQTCRYRVPPIQRNRIVRERLFGNWIVYARREDALPH